MEDIRPLYERHAHISAPDIVLMEILAYASFYGKHIQLYLDLWQQKLHTFLLELRTFIGWDIHPNLEDMHLQNGRVEDILSVEETHIIMEDAHLTRHYEKQTPWYRRHTWKTYTLTWKTYTLIMKDNHLLNFRWNTSFCRHTPVNGRYILRTINFTLKMCTLIWKMYTLMYTIAVHETNTHYPWSCMKRYCIILCRICISCI